MSERITTELDKLMAIYALRECAKQHEKDVFCTGQINTPVLCRDVADYLEADRWYYPNKGELPDKDGEYFIAVKIENRGFIYALAIYHVDRGWLGLYNKPYAWQYIIQPKEQE